MNGRIEPEEFRQLMEPWDARMAAVAEERMRGNYSRDRLEHFTDEEAATMRALLARLIPEDEGVDLVGWIDSAIGKPMGRGDWKPGMPPELELYQTGLRMLDELSGTRFAEAPGERQDEAIRHLREDEVGAYFFQRLYGKALHGYFGHPRVWMRIGFYGAAYPEGYAWLGRDQVRMRHERAPGWDRL
ncbi:MAG TPA: gluconate 2-dehydrogenase subunit 3 family protein [Fimbriimonas sp.]